MKAEAQASEPGSSHARMRGSRALRIRSERILNGIERIELSKQG